MDLGRRNIDSDVEYSRSLERRGDSRSIAGRLRLIMPPARDGIYRHAVKTQEIVGGNIGGPRSLRLLDCNLPGQGTDHVISGIGAADRLVGIEYELTAGGAAEPRAEAGRNEFCYLYCRERDIERNQQRAAKHESPNSHEPAMRPRWKVSET